MGRRLVVGSVIVVGALGCVTRPAGGEAARPVSASPAVPEDVCAEIRGEEHEDDGVLAPRFHCVPTPHGAWALRVDLPDEGSHDLRIVALHAARDGRRARTVIVAQGAALWWPTLAPLDRGVTLGEAGPDGEPELVARLTRIGFSEHEVARFRVTAE
jgi:hypothetical protein